MILEQNDKSKFSLVAIVGVIIHILRFCENIHMYSDNIIKTQNMFTFSFTIGTLNIFFSVFGVASADMIFRKQIEFIQRLKVLVIGQLFLLISDVIFFVMIVDKHNSFNFNFLTFLIALEIFYFLSMFELSLHSKSLWRDQENQICRSTLPSYEEAIIMIDSRK